MKRKTILIIAVLMVTGSSVSAVEQSSHQGHSHAIPPQAASGPHGGSLRRHGQGAWLSERWDSRPNLLPPTQCPVSPAGRAPLLGVEAVAPVAHPPVAHELAHMLLRCLVLAAVAASLLAPPGAVRVIGDETEKKLDLAGQCRKALEPLRKDSYLLRSTVWQGQALGENEVVVPVYLLRGNHYVFSIMSASGKPVEWVLRDREKILINPLAAEKKDGAGEPPTTKEKAKPSDPLRYGPGRSDHYFLHMKLPKGAGPDKIALTYAWQ